jgi:hypothetical protein
MYGGAEDLVVWYYDLLAAAARPARKVASDDATTAQAKTRLAAGARRVLGWPKRWKLAHAHSCGNTAETG